MVDKKTTKGRQKVEMKKISNQAQLYSTFSKRRDGAFKSANELTTLCGTEIALLIPAPSNTTIHSFGTPDVETVVGKLLGPNLEDPVMPAPPPPRDDFEEANRAFRAEQLTQELTLLETIKEGRNKFVQHLKAKENVEAEEEDFFEAPVDQEVNRNKVQERASIMQEVAKKLEETVANRPS